ncbi:hypothetical protein [Nocardiopsis sp. L17-MgMaSL7]|uniref:hypothetical protein n=1 Tax=Nocardiopsis sp. L17-MgMaSL7 TaxID=1938893 RepID=UPI000D711735|nr:hypothetical protein [Nocardiopsis sp. L17-MgMaSL7]PWV44937.1 hypothetical protein BDW27_12051 [Nocardiopsis sp. L17-MgMaSL7]
MTGTLARVTARILERRHVTRSGVTRISLVAAVGAAVWFSRADPVGAVAGSALLGLILCCDAVRDRMRAHRRDALTLWTVSMVAQLREYAVYVGLAFGAAAAGFASAWGWAAGALIALALRDALLVARSAPPAPSNPKPLTLPSQRRPEGLRLPEPRVPRPRKPSEVAGEAATETATRSRPVADGAERAEAPGAADLSLIGLSRLAMAFDQPTRFLVIAVATVAFDARIAFLSLVVGCAVAITGELVGTSSRESRP